MYKKIISFCLLTFLGLSTIHAQDSEVTQPKYGNNFLRVTPITVLDIGPGFGLSYEKLLGKDKMIGIVFPVSLILQRKSFDSSYPTNGQNYNTFIYFTPGIKIYPFSQRRVNYAIGTNLLIGYGGGKQSDYYNINGNPYMGHEYTKTIFRFGILVNNYVNFQITPNFNLGLTGGLGIRYIDFQKSTLENGGYSTINNGFDITGQFALSLGYRF